MSEQRRTSARITLRLLPSEDAAVREAARLAGQTVSFWSRRELLRAAGEKLPAAHKRARFVIAYIAKRYRGDVDREGAKSAFTN